MHQVLVIAGWWTALSLCAVPVWAALVKRRRRAARREAVAHADGAGKAPPTEQSA